MTTMETRSFTVAPVTANIGARVCGFDVGAAHPPSVGEQLTQALHEHGVLFFTASKSVSDEDHHEFARLFGEIDPHDAQSDFFTIDSVLTPMEKYPTDQWHADGAGRACPPQAAVLRCIKAPSVGGDTMWASMYAAYDSLSSHYQRFLDGLEAVHSGSAVTSRHASHKESVNESTHPAVLRDPVTGRRMLYVNSLYTQRFVGLTETESDRLLSMLFDHVNTPDFHVRLRWEPDTIAVWENRITQHRVINDHAEHRTMKRLIIRGERPTA